LSNYNGNEKVEGYNETKNELWDQNDQVASIKSSNSWPTPYMGQNN
jgi:hypothetical protein